MEDQPSGRGEETLARETIVRQVEQSEKPGRRLESERFAEELRGALALAAAAGAIATPVTHNRLLESIVETATRLIGARAASLLLFDEEAQDLFFEVALGEKAAEVKKLRLPLGHGIAGLVAVSGQPMAISDAQKDPRQAADIARKVGYLPQSILCVPLFDGDEVLGVLELLDKVGAPSFTATDMETLGLFASQAALAIQQARSSLNLAALMSEVLASLAGVPEDQKRTLQQQTSSFAAEVEGSVGYRQALDLARLVQEIVHHGGPEAELCRTILSSFAQYLRSRPRPMVGW